MVHIDKGGPKRKKRARKLRLERRAQSAREPYYEVEHCSYDIRVPTKIRRRSKRVLLKFIDRRKRSYVQRTPPNRYASRKNRATKTEKSREGGERANVTTPTPKKGKYHLNRDERKRQEKKV